MTKNEQNELNAAIEQLETKDDDFAEREEELVSIVNRLCEMDDKDYRKFIRYMRYERKAQKHLGSMSQYA